MSTFTPTHQALDFQSAEDFIDDLAASRHVITYRPDIARALSSVLSTILFQQISYWWKCNGSKPFYKFKTPCAHRLYKPGDSWIEELAFSRHEFDSALQNIGHKITHGGKREDAPDALVWYWTDGKRVTWYELNLKAVASLKRSLKPESGYRTGVLYPQSGFTKVKPESGFTLYTETTTEKEIPIAATSAAPVPEVEQPPAKVEQPALVEVPKVEKPKKKPSQKKESAPQAHIAIIEAWLMAQGVEKPTSLQYTRNLRVAASLVKDGYTPDDVKLYTTWLTVKDPYWRTQTQVPLETVAGSIATWKAKQVKPVAPSPAVVPPDEIYAAKLMDFLNGKEDGVK